MGYINVTVDLEELDTYDLLEELENREDRPSVKRFFNDRVSEKLKGLDIENINILDISKLDYFLENFDKITEEQLKQIVENNLK